MTHKYVNNHWVAKHESGIYSILFNTHNRWIEWHRISNYEYSFGEVNLDDSSEWKKHEYRVEPFLDENIRYLPTVIQEKDQITFYFLPYSLIDRKSYDIIENRQI